MSLAVLTPFTGAAASKSGQRRWRKRLLPVGDVHYQGPTLYLPPGWRLDRVDRESSPGCQVVT